MTPTYHPGRTITIYRPSTWSCEGNVHDHKSERAALACEKKYRDAAPVGRYKVMRPRRRP